MPINYQKLKNYRFDEVRHTYGWRDAVIYALGIGFGAEPTKQSELRYLLEDRLQAFPTIATVLGLKPGWLKDPELGVNYLKVLHAEQRLRLYRPVPAEGTVVCRTRIEEVVDKGAAKGAIVVAVRDLFDEAGKTLLASVETSSFCRADGGFGGPVTSGSIPHELPAGAPQAALEMKTSRRAALIYRLSGDLNPIHGDPQVAHEAGFEQPILHGLCTYAIAARAVVAQYCDGNGACLEALDVRFSAPVYPGETLRTELWREGEIVSFRTRVVERDLIVLNNGRAEIKT